MSKAIFRKRGASLVIVDEEGLQALRTVPDGRDVMVEFKRSRNPRHHRLLFALLNLCVERLEAFPTVELALTALKVGCGHVTTFIDQESGKPFYVVKSIAFESMDQTAFNKFFDDAIQLIATRWAPPGTTPESIRREILEICDGPHVAERRA